MFCDQCGAKAEVRDAFCRKCRANVATFPSAPAPQNAAPRQAHITAFGPILALAVAVLLVLAAGVGYDHLPARRAASSGVVSAGSEVTRAPKVMSYGVTAQRSREIALVFSELPEAGDLSDILSCAGANEVVWTTSIKDNPRGPEAHEAKRKAGWYSAVALWVFEVESTAVTDAVKSASQGDPAAVFDLARRCRKAPDSWRE